MKKRGQMEAPIELFVAVIVLAMSLALAFTVMSRTDEGKCIATLRTETDKLQAAMLDVAFASPPTTRTVLFSMTRCGNVAVDGLRFVYYSKPEWCELCQAHYGGCWQIVPVSKDKDGSYKVVSDAVSCVNIAGDIFLRQDPACDELSNNPCPPNDQDCKSGVPRGIWTGDPDSPSRWLTMGKTATGTSYRITLTKSVTAGSSESGQGTESGEIIVCARSATAQSSTP
ncbi:Uncharacterised protein [Candidatus Norongarragalina meridionalis]|nr:Uncharacterised protein [Candidatus Norongarragalina meridionalis]